MNMSKLLSIVVPIYNTDEFLERCLTSILKNEYENYEVILVDDGSYVTSMYLNILISM